MLCHWFHYHQVLQGIRILWRNYLSWYISEQSGWYEEIVELSFNKNHIGSICFCWYTVWGMYCIILWGLCFFRSRSRSRRRSRTRSRSRSRSRHSRSRSRRRSYTRSRSRSRSRSDSKSSRGKSHSRSKSPRESKSKSRSKSKWKGKLSCVSAWILKNMWD